MQPQHLDGVQNVQQQAYHPGLWESTAALAQKQHLSAGSCFVAQTADGQTVAYVFSHPWSGRAIPKLNGFLSALPERSEVLYIHDLAVHPDWHGRRLAQELMAAVQGAARELGLQAMALVAVQGAQSFWQRQGFVVDPEIQAGLQHRLEVYGDGAVYMTAPSPDKT